MDNKEQNQNEVFLKENEKKTLCAVCRAYCLSHR